MTHEPTLTSEKFNIIEKIKRVVREPGLQVEYFEKPVDFLARKA
jgi:hypothetical protein